jgi:formylglycine-generating enzyme required for sulfatase activity
VALALAAWAMSCSGALSDASKPPAFDPEQQAKCKVAKSVTEPLIVEWPSAARAKLEAHVRQGLVAVRYTGCEMKVLERCSAAGKYAYVPLTRKRDRLAIRTADELYANLPVYAASFEGKLEQAGELGVDMTIVGRLEARTEMPALVGDCVEATHVITALTVGAFEFSAAGRAQAGAGVSVEGAGAGTRALHERETLSEDGDKSACDRSTLGDASPPEGCGAVLRVEVAPIPGREAPPPEDARPLQSAGQSRRGEPSAAPVRACGSEAIAVAGATFWAGAADSAGEYNQPARHQVTVAPFCIDRTEVTVGRYAECFQAKRCTRPSTSGTGNCNYGNAGRGNQPVNCVVFEQAKAYCAFRGKRLPTEDEWEYAARGGDGRLFPWGSTAPTKQLCWRGAHDQYRGETCAVASFPDGASPFGVLDMAGSVSEWTASRACFPDGNCRQRDRVVRGGHWRHSEPQHVRTTWRDYMEETSTHDALGFRCVQSLLR